MDRGVDTRWWSVTTQDCFQNAGPWTVAPGMSGGNPRVVCVADIKHYLKIHNEKSNFPLPTLTCAEAGFPLYVDIYSETDVWGGEVVDPSYSHRFLLELCGMDGPGGLLSRYVGGVRSPFWRGARIG